MKKDTRKMPELHHSPSEGRQTVIYPFLVVEAKSRSHITGFESIDAQTAFLLRTCLMVQRKLQEASKVELKHLMWFMPYYGST